MGWGSARNCSDNQLCSNIVSPLDIKLACRKGVLPQKSDVVPHCRIIRLGSRDAGLPAYCQLTKPYWLQHVFRGHSVPETFAYCPHSATASQLETQPDPQYVGPVKRQLCRHTRPVICVLLTIATIATSTTASAITAWIARTAVETLPFVQCCVCQRIRKTAEMEIKRIGVACNNRFRGIWSLGSTRKMDDKSKQETEREEGNSTGRPPLEGMLVGHDQWKERCSNEAEQYNAKHS